MNRVGETCEWDLSHTITLESHRTRRTEFGCREVARVSHEYHTSAARACEQVGELCERDLCHMITLKSHGEQRVPPECPVGSDTHRTQRRAESAEKLSERCQFPETLTASRA